ncbi:MAG: CehA/McbA family metallohydrolase [Planctomycetes bacterium]|nr:CehA/McbA family metallohydrolase [Planctomycetota bacterium]
MRLHPALLLIPAGIAFGFLSEPAAADDPGPSMASGELQVLPFGLMEQVRRTEGTVPMKVQIYNPGEEGVSLEALRVLETSGRTVAEVDLHGERLLGDGGRVADLYLKQELIDPELSHRHSQRIFVPLDQRPVLQPDNEARLFLDIVEGVQELKQSGAPQLRNVHFELDLQPLFAGAREGDEAVIDLVVDYRRADGTRAQAVLTHGIELLPDYLEPPAAWYAANGGGRAAGAWYAGDLHVHNCRDEAVGGCPSCAAESVNITGAFTNADLKPQFQALGMDFFSTTTHSYCIQSTAEFDRVKNEADTLDDPSFVLICGTEVTGEETGPQWGSDSADALCYLGFGAPVHHMGAHAITSRKWGGDDGFLDFCDDPKRSQWNNVPAIKSEGGFAVANHPNGMWGFNSVVGFRGFNQGYTFGTEIWNGNTLTANPPHIWWWEQRMLEGKFTYPMSGSDTHDAAMDFGALHVWVDGVYGEAPLVAGIKAGRSYLSNGPFLDIEMRDQHGRSAPGGARYQVSASKVPPGHPVEVEVYYNVAQSSTIRVYRGQVGAAAEVLLQEFTGVSGGGSVVVPTTVEPTASAWYRAEVEYSNAQAGAWAMPIYFLLK